MLKMAKSELLDFYTAWQIAEEEQAESLKRVATQVEDCPASSHYEKPKRKKKILPKPLKTVNVKVHDDGHDNVSPLEMISMKAAPCDESDVPPDPCSPTEPTSEDEQQNSQWYKDMDDLNDALLSKFLAQALEERENIQKQQAAFQQAQEVAVAMAKGPCLQQGQVAMAKAPWRFQAAPELHGRNADAPVATKPCPKIQAPLPKMQAAWPSTPSLPSVPPAKALVKPQQPCRVTGKAGKAYEGYYYESRKH